MAATTDNTRQEVQSSVTSLYAALLKKRQNERIAKDEEKEIRKQEKKAEKELKKEEEKEKEVEKLSRKEKRQMEIDNWKEIVVGLTGDDLEYVESKPKKKKYRKWIDDEDTNQVLVAKPKKVKKKNYNKEFEAELNMLKSLVADQNKFTNDLQKRYQISAGPNTKDAMPLNKTLVELASAINASRSNSLGVLREIGNIKKTIADLYMKQKKLDADLGTSGMAGSPTDLALMGSNIAASLLGDDAAPVNPYASTSTPYTNNVATGGYTEVQMPSAPVVQQPQPNNINAVMNSNITEFDPSTWNDDSIGDVSATMYENIPHDIVVEKNSQTGISRFKAVRRDNGEELPDCPVPTSDFSRLSFNEKDMTVKGQFDEIYKLEIV